MYLKPSEIHYSQDSISNHFTGSHSCKRVGETLDDICDGRCRIEDIPTITVGLQNGVWVTSDNRRLWVFKHLERLGKCTQVSVYQTSYIPEFKLTSINNGESVTVRRNAGGRWYLNPNAPIPSIHRPVSPKPKTTDSPVCTTLLSTPPYRNTVVENSSGFTQKTGSTKFYGNTSNISIRSSLTSDNILGTKYTPMTPYTGRYGSNTPDYKLQTIQQNRQSTSVTSNVSVSGYKNKPNYTTNSFDEDCSSKSDSMITSVSQTRGDTQSIHDSWRYTAKEQPRNIHESQYERSSSTSKPGKKYVYNEQPITRSTSSNAERKQDCETFATVPVVTGVTRGRVAVAAIDFGTTYSGYAFSFRADFLADPLNISANQWNRGTGRTVSLKAPTCILFNPSKEFDSFGFEAEDKYAELALDGKHLDWFCFKRFKMLLYENMNLNSDTKLKDEKGMKMSAMTVFSRGIRYLKDHLIDLLEVRNCWVDCELIQWVLTVPAIWNDAAKQFMREAAINAGIATEHLSIALEPESASLFCKHLPVTKIQGAKGGSISCLSPGTKYLVLDAGGGTVDITVHETQADHTVRELYKANGGPWGGTKIDEAFQAFLADIIGQDTMEIFMLNHKDDYLDLFREFEIKKGTLSHDMEHKVTFKIPLSVLETYASVNGQDFRRSLMMKHDLKDKITFAGDKLRVHPEQIKALFSETCHKIVQHLTEIFHQDAVKGTDTILMVGGFSESKILQHTIRASFPDKRIIIPADAGLAVLKGAVIFGHNPTVITSRVSKYTYGVKIYRSFKDGVHPISKQVIIDGQKQCKGCFDKHVELDEEVNVGKVFNEHTYYPRSVRNTSCAVRVFTSNNKRPTFVEDEGCSEIGYLHIDMSHITNPRDRAIVVKMIYGDTELGVEAKILKTGQVLDAKFDFLGL